jgi:hypothetical protein
MAMPVPATGWSGVLRHLTLLEKNKDENIQNCIFPFVVMGVNLYLPQRGGGVGVSVSSDRRVEKMGTFYYPPNVVTRFTSRKK